jgi:DNA-binding NarL/FixJ family response regulator
LGRCAPGVEFGKLPANAPNDRGLFRASHDAAVRSGCNDHAVRPTVLIVDDHADFRRAARALLEADGFEVVGEAATGEGAIRAFEELRPRIVLLDVHLPDIDGLAVAERLAGAPAPPAVVLTSSRDAAAYGPRIARTSARGFIPKSRLSGSALADLVD